jgi:DNA-binding MarR family transcriptional regulator
MDERDITETAVRLRRSVTRLNRRLRHSALAGVSPAQASMLATINALEQPSLGDLAAAEQIQPPSVTRLVQSLEEGGLISRTTDPKDRRCSRVLLTDEGRATLATIRQRKTEFLERRLLELSHEEQSRAAELVVLLEHLLGEK